METSSCPWSSLKALSALLEAAILQRQDGLKHDLEVALRKHKPQFIALLKNPVFSKKHLFLKRSRLISPAPIDSKSRRC
jgi:hypothetical protein